MRLPTPKPRYDAQDEAATRAEIERALNRLEAPVATVAGGAGVTSVSGEGDITSSGGATPVIRRRTPVLSKTAAYAVNATTDANALVRCDATGGAFTITLPAAASATGISYTIKRLNAGANAVTVQAAGVETIDGSNTAGLSTQYATLTVLSNGTSWDIV